MANNSLYMKQKNRALILQLLRAAPTSRAELARKTGLTRAAVTLIADGLLAEGLIREGDAIKSEAGRHPTLLHIAPDAYYAAGVDISREGCSVGISDFSGKLLRQQNIPLSLTPQKTVEAVCDALTAFQKDGIGEKLLGVGICVPGPADIAGGTILTPPGMDFWHHFNVAEAFKRLGVPIFFEKDTNALALAEKNSAPDNDNFLFLLADHGLGCGFIRNGKLFTAKNGFGCELGHTSIRFDGPVCSCGNRGCAELYASIPATVHGADTARSWQELTEKAEKGDAVCKDTLLHQAQMLSVACVSAVNMLEPDAIILGGELAKAAFVLIPALEEQLAARSLTRHRHKVTVVSSALPENARTVAAAGLVLENYFLKGQMV